MLDIKTWEVKGAWLGHPRVGRMPVVLTFMNWAGGTFMFSIFMPYLISIFLILTLDFDVSARNSNLELSSVFRFVKDQIALPVTRIQASA